MFPEGGCCGKRAEPYPQVSLQCNATVPLLDFTAVLKYVDLLFSVEVRRLLLDYGPPRP